MATTTNYSWNTPDDTALVKDGASAIRSLGTAIDTTTKNLNPSTTLGDIEYRSSTANTNTRLGIGGTGDVLTVAGGVPTWAAPAGGGATSYALINTGGTSLSGTTTTITGLSGYNKLFILTDGVSTGSSSSEIDLRFNSDTGNNYSFYGGFIRATSSYSNNSTISGSTLTDGSIIRYMVLSDYSACSGYGYIQIDGANSSGIKTVALASGVFSASGTDHRNITFGGRYKGTSVISSISFISGAGSFDAGTVYIFGAN
jgi:hypothetical protein